MSSANPSPRSTPRRRRSTCKFPRRMLLRNIRRGATARSSAPPQLADLRMGGGRSRPGKAPPDPPDNSDEHRVHAHARGARRGVRGQSRAQDRRLKAAELIVTIPPRPPLIPCAKHWDVRRATLVAPVVFGAFVMQPPGQAGDVFGVPFSSAADNAPPSQTSTSTSCTSSLDTF